MTATKSHTAPLESALFPSNLDVLRYLPWAVPVTAESVPFGSDRWDLGALEVWPAYMRHSTAINWAGIESPLWRVTAKEVALCLMQPRVGVEHRLADVRRSPYPPWALPFQRLSYWRRWFAYLDEQGVRSLSSVTQGVCDSFLCTITPESRHIAVSALRAFAQYRPLLTHDAYRAGFRPWGASSAVAAGGEPRVGSHGNKTPIIPDEVFAPLLAAALFFVQVAGPDLVRAKREVERLRSAPARRSKRGDRRVDEALTAYLDRLRVERRSLPAAPPRSAKRGGVICLTTIALNIGVKDPKVLRKRGRFELLRQAGETLGVAGGGLLSEISNVGRAGDSGAAPWRREFGLDDLADMTNLARTACYIVVAALSGMRSSEIAAVERNSITRAEFAPGLIRRHVESSLLKGQPPGGRRETWVVINEVAQAIELAETLTTSRNPVVIGAFAPRFRQFRSWVREHGGTAGLEPIPEDWDLVPRQFRRKLAREIGWRPNGVIAGKIHLKHLSVATTEGYAGKQGESASAFHAEVEHERRQARAAAVERVIRAAERGEPVIGLGAASLAAAIADAGLAAPSDGPQVRDHDDAVRALLKARADTLYIGPLAYCWFTDPRRARCLRHAADKTHPLVGSCEPTKCANATIHLEHAPVWVTGLESLKASLSDRRIPAGERQRVRQKIREVEDVIEPLLSQEEA